MVWVSLEKSRSLFFLRGKRLRFIEEDNDLAGGGEFVEEKCDIIQ